MLTRKTQKKKQHGKWRLFNRFRIHVSYVWYIWVVSQKMKILNAHEPTISEQMQCNWTVLHPRRPGLSCYLCANGMTAEQKEDHLKSIIRYFSTKFFRLDNAMRMANDNVFFFGQHFLFTRNNRWTIDVMFDTITQVGGRNPRDFDNLCYVMSKGAHQKCIICL